MPTHQSHIDVSHHFNNSSFREKIIEHLFVGECLRQLWVNGIHNAEVLFADVDAAGYDVVIDAQNIIRHIQLKSSFLGAKTAKQPVHSRLCKKPSGCVVWINFDAASLTLGPFRWFGGQPGEPLPPLHDFPKAKYTKANAQGVKVERAETYSIPKGSFVEVASISSLVNLLFNT